MFTKASVPLMWGSMLFLSAAPAAAQAPTDPTPTSPSGQIYEIPLDTARGDAAPHRSASGQNGHSGASSHSGGGGTSGGSAGGGSGGGSLRSENNFGSSSHVPGLTSGSTAKGKGKGGGTKGQSTGSGNGGAGGTSGGGNGSQGGSGQASAGAKPAAAHSVREGTSTGGTIVLLIALVGTGIGAGLLSVRAARRSRPPLSE